MIQPSNKQLLLEPSGDSQDTSCLPSTGTQNSLFSDYLCLCQEVWETSVREDMGRK